MCMSIGFFNFLNFYFHFVRYLLQYLNSYVTLKMQKEYEYGNDIRTIEGNYINKKC